MSDLLMADIVYLARAISGYLDFQPEKT